MSTQREDVQINLKIQGIQDFKSLSELNSQVIAQRKSLIKMDKADLGYKEAVVKLNQAVEIQKEWKDQIFQTKKAAKEQVAEMSSGYSRIGQIASGIVGGLSIASVLSAIPAIIGKITDAYAAAEKNRSILTNAFNGDAKIAGASLSMLNDFAAKTPFAMNEAIESYIKLVNRGIIPTRDEMVNLGDIAASQGKGMDQLVEAILDAQTGEFERLKEFGIRASKNGDLVSLSFKGVTKEVKNSDEAIKNAILSFGEMQGVSGIMETVSNTIVGIQSNIGDTWDQIFTKMGQKSEGFISKFYQTYSSALEWINDDLLSTETKAQKLTNAFKNQAAEVNNLEKNINPLLDRYDELKSKGKLNKDEQVELKNVLNQVASTIPGAITQWDQYGNALEMNTGKAREFIKIQQVMLRAQNKEAVDIAQKEIAVYTKLRDNNLKKLNAGETTTMGGNGYEFTFKNTDKQTVAYRKDLMKYNDLIEERRLLIKGLNGNFMDEINNQPPPPPAVNNGRTEGAIQKEIDELKKKKADLDVRSKAYADTIAAIKKLEDDLNSAKGKKITQAPEINQAVKLDKQLTEELKKLGIERTNDTLSEYQREEALVEQKYQKLIEKEQAFLDLKGTTDEQRKTRESEIAALEKNKTLEIAELRVRTEEKMMLDINNLRTSLANKHSTELDKEKVLINKFYDDQELKQAGNADRLAILKKQRAVELTNAEVREKVRLEDEKARIEASGGNLTEANYNQRLTRINAHYDEEIEALRRKFSEEAQLTQEFQDLVNATNANREKDLDIEKKAKKKENLGYAIQGVETLNNAVASIAANNRKQESEKNIKSIEDQRTKELSNKNLTEEQKKVINDRYDAKVKQEKLRAWKADQDAAAKQAVISGFLGAAKALPNWVLAGMAMGAGLANAAVIKAQKPPIFSKGGVVNGPSHAQGGIDLVNNATGDTIGEMEGGEPIMILSKETAKNNTALINELLFNSQYRNGARVSVNSELASQVIRPFRNGGVVQDDQGGSASATAVVNSFDTKSLENKIEEKIDQLLDKWAEGIPFNYRNDIEFRDKISKIKDRVNG